MLHVRGTLGFTNPKRQEAGLAAFDAYRYTEFADRVDFSATKTELSIDDRKEVEMDCLDRFHDAYLALAREACSGFVELREARRTRRAYAGGHLVHLRRRDVGGPITAAQLEWRDPGFAQPLPVPFRIQTFAASPDGRLIAVAGGPQGAIGGDGSLPKHVKRGLSRTEERDWALVGFDAETGSEATRWFGPRWVCGAVGFSPDGSRLVAGSADGHVYGWDPRSGRRLFKKKAHPKGAIALAWSDDGATLVTGGAEGVIKIWNAASMVELDAMTESADSIAEAVTARGGTHSGRGGGFALVGREEIRRT